MLFPYEKETNYWPYDRQRLEPVGEDLIELIDKVKSEFPTSGKPILLGYSGGAYVSYYLAFHDPNEFSAVIPISGGLPGFAKQNSSQQRSQVKIRAFHGKKDRLVGVSSGQNAIKALKEHGLDAQLYISKYGGHQFFFDDPDYLSTTINQLIAEQQN